MKGYTGVEGAFYFNNLWGIKKIYEFMESTPATNILQVEFALTIQCGSESVNACAYEWSPLFQSGAIGADWM